MKGLEISSVKDYLNLGLLAWKREALKVNGNSLQIFENLLQEREIGHKIGGVVVVKIRGVKLLT